MKRLHRLPVKQNTMEWLEMRRTGVSASMLPVITQNREGLLDLWSEHVGLLEPEAPDPDTQEMYDLGHLLEPVIALVYTRKSGRSVKRVNQMVRHPKVPWAFASLDRVARDEERIVELKYAPHRWGDEVDEVPGSVQDQVQWQMYVTGYPVCDVAVLRFGRLDIHTVPANAVYQANLVVMAEWFRDLVIRKEPPPVDGSDGTARTLARLYPRDTADLLEPTPELAALALQIRDATEDRKVAKDREGRVKNAMRLALGESAGVESDDLGFRVSWKRTRDRTETVVDWESVARAYRRLLEGDGIPTDLDAIEGIHTNTITTEGHRVLKARFRDDDTGRWV